jgi:hypothetical protein
VGKRGTTLRFAGKAAQDVLEALTREPRYLILHKDLVQGVAVWWRPNRAGYTTDIGAAGRYSKEEADSIAQIRGDDFPVNECEIGKSLTPRLTVNVEDGNNFDVLKAFTGRPVVNANTQQHGEQQ